MSEEIEYLKKCSFWEFLTEEEKESILKNYVKKEYKAKEIIYSPAKECLGVFLILEGVVRVYLMDDKGNTATVFRMRKGDFCVLSMSCVLSEITFDVEMEAEEPCELLLIPTAVFSGIAAQNLHVENFIYKIMIDKFSHMMNAMQQLMFYSLEQRVISFLLDEAAVTGTDTLKLTKEQIAESIGSAREAVSRVLTKLQKQKLIVSGRGSVTILERKKLYSYL